MGVLRPWQELPAGGAIPAEDAPHPRTGGWRTGLKPRVELDACVNCLLCWLYCPDAAIRVDGETFVGIDYDFCKGCEICAEICPAGAIDMVPEESDVG
jgi:2-oxoacid:acceptor oxidoreductase delta subunit (pyruvate/2-ketoisovalerate family)